MDCRFAVTPGVPEFPKFHAFTGDQHLDGPLQEGHAIFVTNPAGGPGGDPSLTVTGSGIDGATLVDCMLTPVPAS